MKEKQVLLMKEGDMLYSRASRFAVVYILLIVLPFTLLYGHNINAQGGFGKRISINFEDAELSTVLSAIEDSSNVRFTYSTDDLPINSIVTLNEVNKSVKSIVGNLSKTSGLKYEFFSGGSIVLTKIVLTPINGKVIDSSGVPLIGATVRIKGTDRGTITDVDGNFSLEVEEGDVLVFSYVGYQMQEIVVGSQSTINVTLQEGVELEELVVVGYGTQTKVTVTGAVSGVKGEAITKSPAVEITNSLAGRIPGLVVRQSNGEPGRDGATINIRGVNTLGNSSPLVVIDGIPDREGGMGRLSPQDVESVSVLKDASSAIYGARAANGVVLVTTKRGKSGKPVLEYSYNYGLSQPTVIPKMSSSIEYANIMNELPIYNSVPASEWSNAWKSIQTTGQYDSPTVGVETVKANFSPEAVKGYRDGTDPWLYPNTDWFRDTFKKWATQQRHNLQFSGGGEKVKFFTSMGYLHQDAIYKNSATYYKQYNFRINLDARINDYLDTDFGIMVRREDRNYPTVNSGAIFRMLMRGRPTEPAIWPTGEPGPDIENGEQSVVVTTGATGYIKNPMDFVQFNGAVTITNPWIEGLELKLSAALDLNHESMKTWTTPWELFFLDKDKYVAEGKPVLSPSVRSNHKDSRLNEFSRKSLNTNFTAIINYDVTLGSNHNVNALVGVTKEKFTGDNFSAFRRNFLSPQIDQLFAGGSVDQNSDGSAYVRSRLGYYGRVRYNYKQTYLAEFIFRRDGSYIFPKQGRFGFFPGFLVGWNVANENWFNVKSIDYLKFRFSYGLMGNDQVFYNNQLQEFAYLSSYNFGKYPINNTAVTTLAETVLANPNFTWEVAKNTNIGFDIQVLERYSLVFEYFNNKREKILIQESGVTPGSSGISDLLPPTNNGSLSNRGFEFGLNYDGGDLNASSPNSFKYSVGVNGGYAQNRVESIKEVKSNPVWQHQEGKQLNGHLVYLADGVFKDQAAIDANKIDYSGVTGTLKPGDLKFQDYNNDGKISADDRVRLNKSSIPKFQFGITINLQYRNFDFSLLLQGSRGASFRFYTESGDIGNFLKYNHDNRWSIDNPSDQHPRLASRGDTYYTGGNFGENSYFLFSTNYVRLKNLELGYTVPKAILDRVFISKLRIYMNGLNVLTFAKQKIFDPETQSQTGVFYPQQRVINFGLSASF